MSLPIWSGCFVIKAACVFTNQMSPYASLINPLKKKKWLSIYTCRRTTIQSFINLVIILFESYLPWYCDTSVKKFFLKICCTFFSLYFVFRLVKANQNGKVSSCIFKAEEVRLPDIQWWGEENNLTGKLHEVRKRLEYWLWVVSVSISQDSIDFTWVKCYSSHALEQSPQFPEDFYVSDICLLIVHSRYMCLVIFMKSL